MASLRQIIEKIVQEEIKTKLVEQSLTRRKSMSWGEVPSVTELEQLMGGESFDMNLKGMDLLAWEYAMRISPEIHAGGTDTPEELHDSIKALVNAPAQDELSVVQIKEVKKILDTWDDRYGDQRIEEASWSLASSIMGTLGVEWI